MTNRRFQRMAGAALLSLLLLGWLTGCGRLPSNAETIRSVRQALPDADVLDVEAGTWSDGHSYRRYTIAYRDVVFTYENYQTSYWFFSGTLARSRHDYCEALLAHFSGEIAEIAQAHQVEITALTGADLWIENDIAKMEEIDAGLDAMEEIYQLLEDYIPRGQWNAFPFGLTLLTRYGETQQISIHQQDDWDASYFRRLLYLNFKADVEAGLVTGVDLSAELLDAIPQKYIQNLYINGEPYQSGDYEICFLYNLADGSYYTPVGFGVELDYNGGVEDYLQREIIERCYPDADYVISVEDQTSSYTIRGGHYLVQRREDGLRVFRNGRELELAQAQEISGEHAGASYYQWVSAADFAMLMGMSLDRVEEDGVYLRLP